MRLVLKDSKMDIDLTQDEKCDFVVKAAKGEFTYDQIRTLIKINLK